MNSKIYKCIIFLVLDLKELLEFSLSIGKDQSWSLFHGIVSQELLKD